jgi:hypothetical protein
MNCIGSIAQWFPFALCCLVIAPSQAVQAAQLTSSWLYSIDAVGDDSGGDAYEIQGIAMSVQGDRLVVALTGGMPLAGTPANEALDGNIGWGDLFFNFTGQGFSQAEGSLYAIRFASENDSPVAAGLYSGVRSTSLTGINNGFSSLGAYYNAGYERPNSMGPVIPNRQAAIGYFGNGSVPTSIASGTKLAEVLLLSDQELTSLGLNFATHKGSHTFGFSVDRSYLPEGDFLASIFLECANDGVALGAEAVPEPMTIVGSAFALAGLARWRRSRQP